MAGMRNALRAIGAAEGSWAGIPLPLSGLPLTIEPTFPRAEALMKMGAAAAPPDEDGLTDLAADGRTVRSIFWSSRHRCQVVIWSEANGEVRWGLHRRFNPGATALLSTLMAMDAWGVEQEAAAVDTLAGLLPRRMFKAYLLTGMFLETSQRSGLTYLFRRLRPTLALSGGSEGKGRLGKQMPCGMRILAALCLHPIGYYQGSWAGAMCPTDDVLAHLMLMRGDERMFWRRANQHPPWVPEAGL